MIEPTWAEAPLVAVDLEGTGSQDRDQEAILEIAVVPITGGRPVPCSAYSTLINPGRPVPRRPWISPGLNDTVLSSAPPLGDVEPRLAERLTGSWIVGHNIAVDWRLLHRCCLSIQPAGLLDTLKLARAEHPGVRTGMGLTALLDRYELTRETAGAVPSGQPHRALWDAVAAALLLTALVGRHWPTSPTLAQLREVAEIPLAPTPPHSSPQSDTLF
ncbi:3'-5' exonuclease [Actinocatenispora comari]|uniref:Exonuclease domain-containing protein n=1 Tax=Actinocatenispora comari TaxID=2807577 RepID=A0A8J4AJT0_9ACTN|nr:3'-5' exonuclease [Actinocatenispora comari]GIL32059.1 hypothetical protein NUM_73130 [Actinocatenispora comari]